MNFILGISKRCCPVCSHLLHVLQQALPGKVFNTPGSHKTIYPCALPPWLPLSIVSKVVSAFWEQLKQVLLEVVRDTTRRQRRKSTGSHGPSPPTRLLQHKGWSRMFPKHG